MTIDSDEIIGHMAKLKEQRRPFVLATVVRTEGATAAKAGAKAVIRPDGSTSVGSAAAAPWARSRRPPTKR